MNKNLRMVVSLILGAAFFSPAALAKQVVEAEIHGIACSFCAYGLEKKIKKMPGVEVVSVDVMNGTALITMEDSKTMEKSALEKAVSESGFTLKDIKVKEE